VIANLIVINSPHYGMVKPSLACLHVVESTMVRSLILNLAAVKRLNVVWPNRLACGSPASVT